MRHFFLFLFFVCVIDGHTQSIITEHVMPGEYYHDFTPDRKIVWSNNTFNNTYLDINNDGLVDAYIVHYYHPVWNWGYEMTYGLKPAITSQVCELTSDTCLRYNDSSVVYIASLAYPFPYHQTINRNWRWIDSTVYLQKGKSIVQQFYSCGAGTFDTSWHWAGVRIFTPDTLYGWVKMKIVQGFPGLDDTLIIDSYACQTYLTGIQTIEGNEQLHITPNPSGGKFHIDAVFPYATIMVMDMTGRIVFEEKTGNEKMEVDLSAFENGIYYISISDGKRRLHSKLVLVK